MKPLRFYLPIIYNKKTDRAESILECRTDWEDAKNYFAEYVLEKDEVLKVAEILINANDTRLKELITEAYNKRICEEIEKFREGRSNIISRAVKKYSPSIRASQEYHDWSYDYVGPRNQPKEGGNPHV